MSTGEKGVFAFVIVVTFLLGCSVGRATGSRGLTEGTAINLWSEVMLLRETLREVYLINSKQQPSCLTEAERAEWLATDPDPSAILWQRERDRECGRAPLPTSGDGKLCLQADGCPQEQKLP